MNLADVYTIKSILRENRIKPNKHFGQNFLIAQEPLIKLIESANIGADDIIVEIGPGLGTITQELAKKAKLVLTIEKDYQLIQWLRKFFKGSKNVKVIHDDILTFNLQSITGKYKVVSALPYNITSPVIRKFFGEDCQPESIHMIIQKEVAQRICAESGNSERGFLTVFVEFFADAEIIDYVDRICFWPVPGVDSAIVKITLKQNNPSSRAKLTTGQGIKTKKRHREEVIRRGDLEDSGQAIMTEKDCFAAARNDEIDPDSFFRLVKAGFSQKRRQIHHPLSASLHISKTQVYDILKKAGIRPEMRAEELGLGEWMRLYQTISNS